MALTTSDLIKSLQTASCEEHLWDFSNEIMPQWDAMSDAIDLRDMETSGRLPALPGTGSACALRARTGAAIPATSAESSRDSALVAAPPFRGRRDADGIDHRLTPTNHPWINGQVDRLNRTRPSGTVA